MHWLGHGVRGDASRQQSGVRGSACARDQLLLWMRHQMREVESQAPLPADATTKSQELAGGWGKCPCTLPWPEMFPRSPGHSTQGTLLLCSTHTGDFAGF